MLMFFPCCLYVVFEEEILGTGIRLSYIGNSGKIDEYCREIKQNLVLVYIDK